MRYLKKYNEIVDYDNVDIYDLDKYDGNFYYYSKEPIKLEDLPDIVICEFSNRADASDSISNYIYQIKVKNPIYKTSEFSLDDIYDMKDKKIDNKNSGYIKQNWITQEWKAHINKSDIISFKHIGGFNKYDKYKSDKLNINLSDETDSFLYNYISGKLIQDRLTADIIKELEQFKPKETIKIYKGIEEVQIRHLSQTQPPYNKGQIINSDFHFSTSWTTNVLIARRFIDDYPSSTPFVVMMMAKPKDILVDVRMLPKKYYHMDQREIIMKPGEYEYKIIWKGLD